MAKCGGTATGFVWHTKTWVIHRTCLAWSKCVCFAESQSCTWYLISKWKCIAFLYSGWIWRWLKYAIYVTSAFGCFLKWWYPQIIHFNRDFHYKPSILGYPYFWKHPYKYVTPVVLTMLGAMQMHPRHDERHAASLVCCSAVTSLEMQEFFGAGETWKPGKSNRITSITSENNMKCWEPIDFINIDYISQRPSKLLGKNEKVMRRATLSHSEAMSACARGQQWVWGSWRSDLWFRVDQQEENHQLRNYPMTNPHFDSFNLDHLTWWFLMFHVVCSVFHFIDMCFTKWN